MVNQITQSEDRHQSPPDVVLILIWATYHWSVNTGEGWSALFGVVAALLLFLAVTLHELG
jgi:hypothetical protein